MIILIMITIGPADDVTPLWEIRLTVVTDSAICLYAFEMGTLLYMERFNGDTQWGKLIYILIQ